MKPGSEKLSREEIKDRLEAVPGWELKGDALFRRFEFCNFRTAFAFITSVALIAEKMDHHPDWCNSYNRVDISLTGHDAGGITEIDFQLAAVIASFSGECDDAT